MSKQKMDLDPALGFDTIVQALKFKYKQYVIDEMDGLKITLDSDWVLSDRLTQSLSYESIQREIVKILQNIGRQIMQDIEEMKTKCGLI